MFLYVITLVTLMEDLEAEYPGILDSFRAYDVAFYESVRQSAQLLNMLM